MLESGMTPSEILEGQALMVSIDGVNRFHYAVTVHETCLEVHAQTDGEVKKYGLTYFKKTKEMLERAFIAYPKYDIIIMDVLPEYEKWAKTLGFTESKNYDDLLTMEGHKTFALKRGRS